MYGNKSCASGGDLTAKAFIAAFKRFVSRRGLITDLHSDNGTNFVLAKQVTKWCESRR